MNREPLKETPNEVEKAKEVEDVFDHERGRAHQRMEDALAPDMTVGQVMTPRPATVESNSTAVDAARAMVAENVGSLPVVDDEKLVGMVTDRDLVISVLARNLDPNKVTVAECCSEGPTVAHPDEPLDAALQRMAREQVRRLPVVDEGRLVGIVAQADVARAAQPESTGLMVEEISQA